MPVGSPRPNAGAPKGNLNAVKNGASSKQIRKAMALPTLEERIAWVSKHFTLQRLEIARLKRQLQRNPPTPKKGPAFDPWAEAEADG